eukprot:8191898-Alexandrium_andersonii.AAC.1
MTLGSRSPLSWPTHLAPHTCRTPSPLGAMGNLELPSCGPLWGGRSTPSVTGCGGNWAWGSSSGKFYFCWRPEGSSPPGT